MIRISLLLTILYLSFSTKLLFADNPIKIPQPSETVLDEIVVNEVRDPSCRSECSTATNIAIPLNTTPAQLEELASQLATQSMASGDAGKSARVDDFIPSRQDPRVVELATEKIENKTTKFPNSKSELQKHWLGILTEALLQSKVHPADRAYNFVLTIIRGTYVGVATVWIARNYGLGLTPTLLATMIVVGSYAGLQQWCYETLYKPYLRLLGDNYIARRAMRFTFGLALGATALFIQNIGIYGMDNIFKNFVDGALIKAGLFHLGTSDWYEFSRRYIHDRHHSDSVGAQKFWGRVSYKTSAFLIGMMSATATFLYALEVGGFATHSIQTDILLSSAVGSWAIWAGYEFRTQFANLGRSLSGGVLRIGCRVLEAIGYRTFRPVNP